MIGREKDYSASKEGKYWIVKDKNGNEAGRGYIEDFSTDKAIIDSVIKSNNANAVPDAPFKKSWHELALKRMIREAAEKGYDRLSWTPGEAQAARYDLSKQIKEISVLPNTSDTAHVSLNARSGVHASAIIDKNGKIINGYDAFKDAVGKDLKEVVGKEVSEKILDRGFNIPKRPDKLPEGYELIKDGDKWGVTPPNQDHARSMVGLHTDKAEAIRQAINQIHAEQVGNHGLLKDVDLKIGGEGMKGFYDSIIPKALEKIGKEHGVKVKQGTIRGHQYKGYDSYEAAQGPTGGNAVYGIKPDGKKVLINQSYSDMAAAKKAAIELNAGGEASKTHYINIPQSLKDQAMHKGFPLFSKGGYMLMPVDHTPDFGDK